MTDLYQPDDDPGADDARETARRAAAGHTAAARDVEAFLRRAPAVPSPADIAEYSELIAREQLLRSERQTAAEAAGYTVPSIEPQ